MKRLIVGFVLGVLLSLTIPAAAHRDSSVSKHFYNHIHNMAHRLIDVEEVVWVELPSFLANIDFNGTYTGPVQAQQIRVDPACVGSPAMWKSDGANVTLGC